MSRPSIDNKDLGGIRLFPSPSTGYLCLSTEGHWYEYELIDIHGRPLGMGVS